MQVEPHLDPSTASRFKAERPDREHGPAAGPETLFFVHIPKCAGSSFRQVLKRWFGAGALCVDTHDPAVLARAVEQSEGPPRALAGHMPFGLHAGLPLRPCYVSLVRHPLDRFVSFHGHARRTPSHPMHPAASRLGLEAFYDFSLENARARGSTVGVQCYFLSRSRSFEAARAVIDRRYALVAPTERYAEFVAALAHRFGRPAPTLEPRNVGQDGIDLEAARAALGPRIAADHGEDLRLFTEVSDRFDARRESLLAAADAVAEAWS